MPSRRYVHCSVIENYDANNIAQEQRRGGLEGLRRYPARNATSVVTTLVPVMEMVPQLQSRVCMCLSPTRSDAGDSDCMASRRLRWLIVTDLGMSYHGWRRRVECIRCARWIPARPSDHITVKLYARNNDELGSADHGTAQGRATFAPGPSCAAPMASTATAIMAFRPDGDFAFLDLTKACLRVCRIVARVAGLRRKARTSSCIATAVSLSPGRDRPSWAPCCAIPRAGQKPACRRLCA